jgi:hypothetical protein
MRRRIEGYYLDTQPDLEQPPTSWSTGRRAASSRRRTYADVLSGFATYSACQEPIRDLHDRPDRSLTCTRSAPSSARPSGQSHTVVVKVDAYLSGTPIATGHGDHRRHRHRQRRHRRPPDPRRHPGRPDPLGHPRRHRRGAATPTGGSGTRPATPRWSRSASSPSTPSR